MEGVHEDVVLCLEDKHVVERTRDAERHCIRERTLTERIDEEHCTRSSNWSRVCNADPGTHTQAVRQFPLTTHVSIDANQEVEDNELERTTVVEPFIQTGCFPDGIEVQTNSIRRRNNSTRNDVVTVEKRTRYWFTNPVASSNKQPYHHT